MVDKKATEKTALQGNATDDDEKVPQWVVKFGAPLALTFYITVAVVKTMLTKALFEGGAAFPVGFSAISAIATCTVLIPVFVADRTQWAVPKRDYMPGFLLVCTLVALDLALTNIAVALLAVAIQQCIVATNPAFTVTIESIVRRKLAHPMIYLVIVFLCTGPVVAQVGAPADEADSKTIVGIFIQLAGVTCSACKYVFAHSVMQKCKKDLGTFAFLFWIDTLILFILIPWSLINGELIAIISDPETPMEWFNLLFTAVLGGIRFFSQLLVLKVSTATTLSCANLAFQAINIYLSLALFGKPTLTVGLVCGSAITLSSAGVYTYFKITKVLEKDAGCVQKNEDFKACCGKLPCCKGSNKI
jgi:drug/metabolite transporter (DMT)-like permease